MITNILIFAAALYMVIRGSTMATKYAGRLAESFRISKYTIGFIVIAVISILPETFISINAAIRGIPSFGLGMLLGSNIADLTLIFAILVFNAGRSLKVESKIFRSHALYPFLLLLPILLGLDGHFSRLEGAALIVAGAAFYWRAFRDGRDGAAAPRKEHGRYKSFLMLLLSMAILLLGAHLTVAFATSVAYTIGISPILVGILIVGLGTTMPELFFSLRSITVRDDSMAIGDLLGTVLADATIVVGVLALAHPFAFPQKIIYTAGTFMVVAAFMLFQFMRSGRALTKREAWMLLAFWTAFIAVEMVVS